MSALLKYLVAPGLDIGLSLGRVRDDVMKETSNKQEPFIYGSLGGSVVTLASLSREEHTDVPQTDVDASAARDYEAAAKIGTREAWDTFLSKYSIGFFADLARLQRNKIGGVKPNNLKTAPTPSTNPKQKTDDSRQASLIECCVQYAINYSRKHPEYGGPGSRSALVSSCRQQIRNGATHYCSIAPYGSRLIRLPSADSRVLLALRVISL